MSFYPKVVKVEVLGVRRSSLATREDLIPPVAKPVLDTAVLLRKVVNGTMSDNLHPDYKTLIKNYSLSLTSTLKYARQKLGQTRGLKPTWKEHILVQHFPVWLAQFDGGKGEKGAAQVSRILQTSCTPSTIGRFLSRLASQFTAALREEYGDTSN